MTDYHAIFSAESKVYHKWQSILLAHTHKQVQQPGSLICLLSGQEDPDFLDGYSQGQIVTSRIASYNVVNRDHFAGYNKNSSFCDYVTRTPTGNRVYLLLDPDMVFTRSWEPTLETGEEIGELVGYMDPDQESGKSVVRRYARRHADRVQAVGFPLVMRESALREIMDRWHLLTEVLRGDRWVREKLNWVTDMWAFSIACAEFEVRFRLGRNCSFTIDGDTDKPLIHYTYSSRSPSGYHFDKRSYTPWNPLPKLRSDVPAAGRQFHEIFDDFLKDKRGTSLR
jgi:hypothetical protein